MSRGREVTVMDMEVEGVAVLVMRVASPSTREAGDNNGRQARGRRRLQGGRYHAPGVRRLHHNRHQLPI